MSEDLLSKLPESKGSSVCANCKSTDWNQARTDKLGNVIMCNKCPGVPADWDALGEVQ